MDARNRCTFLSLPPSLGSHPPRCLLHLLVSLDCLPGASQRQQHGRVPLTVDHNLMYASMWYPALLHSPSCHPSLVLSPFQVRHSDDNMAECRALQLTVDHNLMYASIREKFIEEHADMPDAVTEKRGSYRVKGKVTVSAIRFSSYPSILLVLLSLSLTNCKAAPVQSPTTCSSPPSFPSCSPPPRSP